jgi:hypothetical protein
MKIIIPILALVLFSNIIVAQDKTVQEKTLQEIDGLVDNAMQFLGKKESVILAAGRPASVTGGDEWKAAVINTRTKESKDSSRTIEIKTGCGDIWLLVSSKTGLVYTISYMPLKKNGVGAADIMSHLGSKYRFDKSNDCVFRAKDSSYNGISVREGVILIVALKKDKKKVKFEK